MTENETGLAVSYQETAEKMDRVVEQYSLDAISGCKSEMKKMLMLATGVKQLAAILNDEIMELIMYFQGKQIGFLTDKDKEKGYDAKAVKACVIEALLSGLRVVGNEFNIISGKTYTAKAGYARKLKELPGFTDLELRMNLGEISGGYQNVIVDVSWKMHGKPMCLLQEIIPVKVNSGMGSDAVLGKAERKTYARVYRRCTGSVLLADGEVDHESVETDYTVKESNGTAPARDPFPPGKQSARAQKAGVGCVHVFVVEGRDGFKVLESCQNCGKPITPEENSRAHAHISKLKPETVPAGQDGKLFDPGTRENLDEDIPY